MIKNEGPLSLFKGMSSPLMGLTFINAVVFFTYGKVKDILKVDESFNYGKIFVAGCASGLTSSVLVTPIELIKIRVQSDESRKGYGSFQTARHVLLTEGVRGLYRGLSVTAWKEIPSYGIYFASYELYKNNIFKILKSMKERATGPVMAATSSTSLAASRANAAVKPTSNSDSVLRQFSMFLAGGLAGVTSWAQCYPVDTIKSRVQSNSTKYKGAMDCIRQTYRSEGIPGFFGGFRATMYRAFLTNAVTFLTYEIVVDAFHYYSKGLDASLPPPIHPV